MSNSYDEIMERMIKPLEKVGFNYKEILAIDPLYIEKSDPIVSSLMEAYRAVSYTHLVPSTRLFRRAISTRS